MTHQEITVCEIKPLVISFHNFLTCTTHLISIHPCRSMHPYSVFPLVLAFKCHIHYLIIPLPAAWLLFLQGKSLTVSSLLTHASKKIIGIEMSKGHVKVTKQRFTPIRNWNYWVNEGTDAVLNQRRAKRGVGLKKNFFFQLHSVHFLATVSTSPGFCLCISPFGVKGSASFYHQQKRQAFLVTSQEERLHILQFSIHLFVQ